VSNLHSHVCSLNLIVVSRPSWLASAWVAACHTKACGCHQGMNDHSEVRCKRIACCYKALLLLPLLLLLPAGQHEGRST
jgi:hypothetical protein